MWQIQQFKGPFVHSSAPLIGPMSWLAAGPADKDQWMIGRTHS